MKIRRREDVWYIIQEVKMGSHVGTHIEFPYHHLKNGKSAADYPLERLVGDAVVLDLSHKKKNEIFDTNTIPSSSRTDFDGHNAMQKSI